MFGLYKFLIPTLCGLFLATAAESNSIVVLNSESFTTSLKENNHFVMFFAPWCGHCKALHPTWEKLAEIMNVKEDAKVKIAQVDCTEEQELCSEQGIRGYPTLLFFKLGEEKPIKFQGERTMPEFAEFINKLLNEDNEVSSGDDTPQPSIVGKMIELTEENFANHVSSGNHFVKFYAPWCSHCQRLAPTWDELAKALQNEKSVSIAKIDCTVYRPICQDFDVKGYPTLLWIEDGKKIEKYSGTRDQQALKEYVLKMLGSEDKAGVVPPPNADEKQDEEVKLEVIQLTGDDFENTIGDGITFVKFYAPWCGHCRALAPTWDQLAEIIHAANNGVKIAKVDCTADNSKSLCSEQGVDGYPTLYAYKNGERQSEEYSGDRKLSDLQAYIKKVMGHDEL